MSSLLVRSTVLFSRKYSSRSASSTAKEKAMASPEGTEKSRYFVSASSTEGMR